MDDADRIEVRIAKAEERVRQQEQLIAELNRAGQSQEARRAREQLATITESLNALRLRVQQARMPRHHDRTNGSAKPSKH